MRIFLPLNSICNYDCSYCVAKCNHDNRKVLNPFNHKIYKENKIIDFINYHFNKDDDVISFSGGEPSHIMNRDMVFHYMRNTDIKFELMSNLSDPKFILQTYKYCRIIYLTLHREEDTEDSFIDKVKFLLSKGITNLVIKEILFPNIKEQQLSFRDKIYDLGLEHEFEKLKPYKEGFYTNEELSLLKIKDVTIGSSVHNLCQCSSDHDTIMINFNGDITKCWYMNEPIANLVKDDYPIKFNTYIKEYYTFNNDKLEINRKYIKLEDNNLFDNLSNKLNIKTLK